jgi:hypothetical protein
MSKRDYIRWGEKCAALICLAFDIPYEHAKAMHVDFVNGLVEYDHYPIRKCDGGPDKFFNLTPRLRPGHRFKTATKDIPEVAKGKRITKANAEFRRRILEKTFGEALAVFDQFNPPARPKRKIPSRPFPKTQRKMRSK